MKLINSKVTFRIGSTVMLMLTMLFSPALLASQQPVGNSWSQRADPAGARHNTQLPWEARHVPHAVIADNGEYRKSKQGTDKHWKDKNSKDKSWQDKDRKRRFEALSPEEQEKIRERRKAFKALPPEEQERIERAREKFRNLPPERREEIREKWRNMSPEQRKEYHRRMENDEHNRNYQ